MLKHDISTFIGLIIGLLFVFGSLLVSGSVGLFWNLPSLFIIVGGTTAALIMAYPPKRLKSLGSVIKKAFSRDNYDIRKDINTLVHLAELARKEGFLALEDSLDQYNDDKFLKRGVQLIIDGAGEDELRYSLDGATHFMKKRHKEGAAMLDMIAATAPALGLLGTYVGLIPMLNNIKDPDTLGPLMSLELVSSFYGALIAYVIFSPLAKRLKNINTEEETRRELIVEGLVAILEGKRPQQIKEDLSLFMNLNSATLDKNK